MLLLIEVFVFSNINICGYKFFLKYCIRCNLLGFRVLCFFGNLIGKYKYIMENIKILLTQNYLLLISYCICFIICVYFPFELFESKSYIICPLTSKYSVLSRLRIKIFTYINTFLFK